MVSQIPALASRTGSTTTEDRLLSHSTVPFGVEYGKHIKGGRMRTARCLRRNGDDYRGGHDVPAGPQLYAVLPTSQVSAVQSTQSCLLSEQRAWTPAH